MVRETHHKSPALRGESRSRAWHDEIKNQFHGANTQDPFQIRRLRRSELPVNTVKLARFLIGKTLVHDSPKGRMSGRIVETEAYPIGDAAGHAFGGETPSRRSRFLQRGRWHAYFTHGLCFLVNVSSEKASAGAGVLLWAL